MADIYSNSNRICFIRDISNDDDPLSDESWYTTDDSSDEDNICAICHEPCIEPCMVESHPDNCTKVDFKKCLADWYKAKPECPICHYPIGDQSNRRSPWVEMTDFARDTQTTNIPVQRTGIRRIAYYFSNIINVGILFLSIDCILRKPIDSLLDQLYFLAAVLAIFILFVYYAKKC